MDPLALLSDDEGAADESDAAEGAPLDADGPDAKRARTGELDFEALQRAGYCSGDSGAGAGPSAEESLRSSFAALERTHEASKPASKEGDAHVPLTREAPSEEVHAHDESGAAAPAPWLTFDEAEQGLPPVLLSGMRARGFSAPTPIQAHAWPILAAGRDAAVMAKAGAGKTLAFLLPCLARLLQEDGPQRAAAGAGHVPAHLQRPFSRAGAYSPPILVLVPTREVASHVEQEAAQFSPSTGIAALACCGRDGLRSSQLGRLREHPGCVVATLGRLLDFLDSEKHWFSIRGVRCLVVDGAERVVDEELTLRSRRLDPDGELPRLVTSYSVEQLRSLACMVETPKRQTMIFSQEVTDGASNLAPWILKSPVDVRLGPRNPLRASRDAEQRVLIVPDEEDVESIAVTFIRRHYAAQAARPGQTIVFAAGPEACEAIAGLLREALKDAVGVEFLHDGRSPSEQDAAAAALRRAGPSVLVTTSGVGFGLGARDVDLVVACSPPADAADYVQRVGCGGRPGRRGLAVALLRRRADARAMGWVAEVMRCTGIPVPRHLSEALRHRRLADAPPSDRRGVFGLAELAAERPEP